MDQTIGKLVMVSSIMKYFRSRTVYLKPLIIMKETKSRGGMMLLHRE
jgi:hypothetical protein